MEQVFQSKLGQAPSLNSFYLFMQNTPITLLFIFNLIVFHWRRRHASSSSGILVFLAQCVCHTKFPGQNLTVHCEMQGNLAMIKAIENYTYPTSQQILESQIKFQEVRQSSICLELSRTSQNFLELPRICWLVG